MSNNVSPRKWSSRLSYIFAGDVYKDVSIKCLLDFPFFFKSQFINRF